MIFDEVIDRKGTYSTQWDFIEDRFGPNTKDITPFSISDMDFRAPKEILDGIVKRTEHGIFGYSRWNHKDYKNAIVGWYEKRYGVEIEGDWVVYSPNVIYSISSLLKMLLKKDEAIMTHTPKYDGFTKILKNYEVVEIPLKEIEKGEFVTDFQLIESELKKGKVKIFILCNPENPTGKVWKESELERLVDLTKKYGVIIISDDIHMDIARKKVTPIVKISKENTIILNSPSKTFNIPALGGSYAIIPDISIRERFLDRLKNIDSLSSPTIFSVLSTIIAYTKCEYWVEELNSYLTKNCEYVVKELDGYKNIRAYIPEGTYLMWIDFGNCGINMERLKKALIEIGKVGIMSGETYGDKNRLRLNVGAPKEKVKIAVEAIKKSIDSIW